MKQAKVFFLFLLTTCLFAACSSDDDEQRDDRIWDIYPIEFEIFITDSEGNDLLDSTYQNNIINEVSASYQGEVYPLKKYPDRYYYMEATTRMYVPHFEGLLLKRYWNSMTYTYGNFEMVFGEFDGMENVDKREIILHLPNSYQVRLSYKNNFKWKSNGDPQKNTQFFLDDQELKDNAGTRGYFNFRYSKNGNYEYIPSGS